ISSATIIRIFGCPDCANAEAAINTQATIIKPMSSVLKLRSPFERKSNGAGAITAIGVVNILFLLRAERHEVSEIIPKFRHREHRAFRACISDRLLVQDCGNLPRDWRNTECGSASRIDKNRSSPAVPSIRP